MQHRQPRWVHEHLYADKLGGDIQRKKFNFKEDPLIYEAFRTTNRDYKGSGFDRGHLCPAADASFDEEAMRDTFYLSNISPQQPLFNRGHWLKLEKYVRKLTEERGEIHVFTGSLYLPSVGTDGKRYVKYQVIGESEIAAPTHYFKVIFDAQMKPINAFVLPNEKIPDDIVV